MAKPRSPKTQTNLTSDQYARLRAEAKNPYQGLRFFIYLACGASGFIGALVFLARLAAGRDIASTLPNFALQLGVVAAMVWLFRWERNRLKN